MLSSCSKGKRRIVCVKKRKCRMLDGEANSVVESGNDMCYEILSRLPAISLITSKCVCKAWRDFSSDILVRQRKMPFLSAQGVFFMVDNYINYIRNKIENYLIYAPLTTNGVICRVDSPRENIINYVYNDKLLGNLSIDLNPLYVEPSLMAETPMLYTAHKGLILSIHSDGTCKVFNPATKQALELPKPPYIPTFGVYMHTIINLSCMLSSSACSFVVMRFLHLRSLVDLYSPITQKWVQCGFSLKDRQLHSTWDLDNCVYLAETKTLYFLTTQDQATAFQFGSFHYEPQICASYSFSLPDVGPNRHYRRRLGESRGCLYLSHVDMEKSGIWIWKRCFVSSTWILLFEFSESAHLCKPVVEKHLAGFYNDDRRRTYIMGFHPEIELVYIYVTPNLLFAYDLTSDTWVQIGVLAQTERLQIPFAHSYTPCLASLGPFMS